MKDARWVKKWAEFDCHVQSGKLNPQPRPDWFFLLLANPTQFTLSAHRIITKSPQCQILSNMPKNLPYRRVMCTKKKQNTWESLSPRRSANFFLSGLLMYFCIWNRFSRPFRWESAILREKYMDYERPYTRCNGKYIISISKWREKINYNFYCTSTVLRWIMLWEWQTLQTSRNVLIVLETWDTYTRIIS